MDSQLLNSLSSLALIIFPTIWSLFKLNSGVSNKIYCQLRSDLIKNVVEFEEIYVSFNRRQEYG